LLACFVIESCKRSSFLPLSFILPLSFSSAHTLTPLNYLQLNYFDIIHPRFVFKHLQG
jgi:hypothetical protein